MYGVHRTTCWGAFHYDWWKMGYINHRGAVVIPIEFEEANPFAKGTAQVMLNGQRMVIDMTGRVLK